MPYKKIEPFVFLWFIIFLSSCGNVEQSSKSNVVTEMSTDTAKLTKFFDLGPNKPLKVKFKYTFIDNSGSDQRITVPGPSDLYLQAILYYSDSTFRQLTSGCDPDVMKYLSEKSEYSKEEFDFEWLDSEVKKELKSDSLYHGFGIEHFYKAPFKGDVWMLHHKILLHKTP